MAKKIPICVDLCISASNRSLKASRPSRRRPEGGLDSLRAILDASGSGLERVVKTTVFLTDLGDFTEVNEVYARFFPHAPPARATVQVAALPRGVGIEIEAVALA